MFTMELEKTTLLEDVLESKFEGTIAERGG
jgi:hypothetical protein